MIATRRLQRSFADGFITEEVTDLWEPWMRQADQVLEDDALLTLIQQEMAKRLKKSKTRGRPGTTAEVVLRMLLLKHVRDFSFQELTREVRANLVYREFTRIGGGKVPDDKTMGRLARQLGPAAVKQVHQRMVGIAQEEKIVQGRKMRVDTTVVETNIHYPTDSSLLGDGVRVLIRGMKKVEEIAGKAGATLRDRSRSVKLRVLEIARAARSKGEQSQKKLQQAYQKLLASTSRVVGQAKRFAEDIASGVKSSADIMQQAALEGLRAELDTMAGRVQQVMRQTKARVFDGNTHYEGKLFSVFETSTEAIRKGKAGKPTEFGKMVKIQEAENQIVIDFEVYDKRPDDRALLVPAIEVHEQQLGQTPRLLATDAGFHSAKNQAAAQEKGVERVCIPNRSTKSAETKREQKKRWFRNGQKWRTGCEGRISVLKRRHGLNRSRYKGDDGIKRWVGLGVIADNLINIGRAMALRT
jgi:transposase, IS5 family